MKNLFWLGIVLLALLAGCGQNESPTRPNEFTPLTSIKIFAPYSTIAPNTSTPLSAIGSFSGLFTRDITAQVAWVSGTPATADFITPANRVKGGINPGITTLTATMGDVTASFNLRVTAATIANLAISPASPPPLPSGLNSQFVVSGTFSDATTQDLTFDAIWASSDTAVAKVSNDVGSKGLAHGVAIGSTKIRATFDNMSSSVPLTVTAAALQSIVVTPASPSLLNVSTGSFTATGHYSDGTAPDITKQVSWSSSSTAIASIAADGTATTLKQGTTAIVATLAGVSGTTTLKVTGGDLLSIALTPAVTTLVNGTVSRITATGSFNNGTSRDITGMATWNVVATNIATVAKPGGNMAWLKASTTESFPTTTYTASYGTGTSTVTSAVTNLSVTTPAPTLNSGSLKITPASLNLNVGTSGRFNVTGTFSNGSTQDLTANAVWTSSVTGPATVGNVNTDAGLANNGRVTGIAPGLVTITAGYGPVETVTAQVTVTQQTLKAQGTGLTISPASLSLSAGAQQQFTAMASYIDGTIQDVTEDTVWTIDKSNVAIPADSQNLLSGVVPPPVVQPGLVMAVDSGTATLTATFGGQTQTTTITVP